MTWKTVTTAILECPDPESFYPEGPHITYYRFLPAPKAGDIVTCPYCGKPAVVKATTETHRTYKEIHRARKIQRPSRAIR